jgi:hypothetical protein
MTQQQWQTVRRNDIQLAGIGPIRQLLGITPLLQIRDGRLADPG